MKRKFREVKLSGDNKDRLLVINEIIEEYQAQGYKLTLRQLYYQLVSRDVIPNKQAEYAKLSKLLKEGRMGGIVDWDAIEDRLRVPKSKASFDSPADVMDAAINQYELPRQKGQNVYLEVWVEKDALSGVLSRVTNKYHVPILVNRGYSSVSAMYDAFMRFVRNGAYEGKGVKILYLGDYDLSGLDMIRDIESRIREFQYGYDDGTDVEGMPFEVIPIALTLEQIEEYNPPPNTAKRSDPRAAEFIAKFGASSWEVDALKPEVLNRILTEAIEDEIDSDMFTEIVSREAADKAKLRNLKKQL